MAKSKYLISTVTGQIPNIVLHTETDSLKGGLILYLDDFLYKDSIYDTQNCDISLRELCAINKDREILLAFKKSPKTLFSKRGNFKLSKERYSQILKIMKPDFYLDYSTLEIISTLENNSKLEYKFVEPKDCNEFYELAKKGGYFLGTNFANEITKNKQMIKFENNKLEVVDAFDCTCCGDLEKEYLGYLLSINEINGFTYLTTHNYNILKEVIN
ncbi:hypothetical protein NGRA_0952 [Nosema granulosis]|uniref:Uncharacterized protein n=1 Tax=Nosema granulosis TaxID=83296 RepID=A0A9P6H2L8_9MICR|nr:hypothetical protein NGRA_0952 [Nosema granulosis]